MNKKTQPNVNTQALINWNNKVIELLSEENKLLLQYLEENDYTESELEEKLKQINIKKNIMRNEAEILAKQSYNSKFVEHSTNR